MARLSLSPFESSPGRGEDSRLSLSPRRLASECSRPASECSRLSSECSRLASESSYHLV